MGPLRLGKKQYRPQTKPDKACHSKQGVQPGFPDCPWGRVLDGEDNKRVFLLMRIIYHHYINLINVMGPVQREEITGH